MKSEEPIISREIENSSCLYVLEFQMKNGNVLESLELISNAKHRHFSEYAEKFCNYRKMRIQEVLIYHEYKLLELSYDRKKSNRYIW
jgi:hypothetical protein